MFCFKICFSICNRVETNLMDLIKSIDFHEENNSTNETKSKSYLDCLTKMFEKNESKKFVNLNQTILSD